MKKLLVYCGAVLLEAGDYQGKDAAVNNELHEKVFRTAHVCRNYWCEDWLVCNIVCCKFSQSSSSRSKASARYNDVVQIFCDMETSTGVEQADAFLVVRPKAAQAFRAEPSGEEPGLGLGFQCLIWISIQGRPDGVGSGQGQEVWMQELQ